MEDDLHIEQENANVSVVTKMDLKKGQMDVD